MMDSGKKITYHVNFSVVSNGHLIGALFITLFVVCFHPLTLALCIAHLVNNTCRY